MTAAVHVAAVAVAVDGVVVAAAAATRVAAE